jgi:hypothetical protein
MYFKENIIKRYHLFNFKEVNKINILYGLLKHKYEMEWILYKHKLNKLVKNWLKKYVVDSYCYSYMQEMLKDGRSLKYIKEVKIYDI